MRPLANTFFNVLPYEYEPYIKKLIYFTIFILLSLSIQLLYLLWHKISVDAMPFYHQLTNFGDYIVQWIPALM